MKAYLLRLLFVLSISSIAVTSKGQSDNNPKYSIQLHREIVEMDSLLFEVAFNKCDLEVWQRIMSLDLEFYDDRTGLNTSRDVEINSFKDRCSKPYKVTRRLVNTSVHKLGDFGAVQLGEHDFYVDDEKVENAKFIHIWEKAETSWIVSRVVSYDHKPIE